MFQVHINSVGTLNTFNLWILLRKIVIYLLGRKFHLHELFRCLSWRSYQKWRQSRHASCICTITKRILNSKNMPKWMSSLCLLHSCLLWRHGNNLDSEKKSRKMKFSRPTKYITIFLSIIQRLKVFQIPTEFTARF